MYIFIYVYTYIHIVIHTSFNIAYIYMYTKDIYTFYTNIYTYKLIYTQMEDVIAACPSVLRYVYSSRFSVLLCYHLSSVIFVIDVFLYVRFFGCSMENR
jgi:hypothetical protein